MTLMTFVCDRCGAEAAFICTVCRAPFCTVKGCAADGSHHPCLPYPEAIPDDGPPEFHRKSNGDEQA